MAPRIIYSYEAPPGVIKAPNTPDAPILLVANNVTFVSTFENQATDETLQDFANFLASCRLRYALADIPTLFYPKQVCEFYSTCTYQPSTDLITGTIADGTRHVTISVENIRTALRLPTFTHYSALPTAAQLQNLLPLLDYNPALGNRTHLVLR
ncbi:hypothetical protein LXL04_017225 [Taraxacum kok-saghyz]